MDRYVLVLCHHGIKGQKWGRRRFQYKDGDLTPEGKKRYGYVGEQSSQNTDKKSGGIIQKHKDKLVQQYKDRGYSQNAAEVAAKQRMKTEALVAGVATVAAAVIVTKAAKRIGEDYCNKVIKSGKKIQNIGPNSDSNFKDAPFFAAVNKHDKKAYGMLYANEKRGMILGDPFNAHNYKGIYNNQIEITKDVKRASINNARKTLYEKMESDPSFKSNVLNTLKRTAYGQQENVDVLYKNNPKKFYDRFNQALATPQFQQSGIHKQYYSELQKKGYNAILDINDTRYSGYKQISKAPTIFFGDDKWKKISNTKIDENDITKNAEKYTKEFMAKQATKVFTKAWARNVAIIAGVKNVSDRRKIEKYLDEHPNSELSGKEILEIVKKEKK